MKKNITSIQFAFYPTPKVFTAIEGEVKEISVIAQRFVREGEGDNWRVTLYAMDGEQRVTLNPNQCHATIEDYRENKSIEHYVANVASLGIDDEGVFYTIEAGQVVSHAPKIDIVDAELVNDCWRFSSPSIPKGVRLFKRMDVALQMAKTPYIDINGEQKQRDGILALLMPNDEQKAALQAMVDAYKKAKELGVEFAYNHEHESLYAWNTNNVAETATMYCGDKEEDDDGWECALIEADGVCDDFYLPLDFQWMSEEYYIVAKREADAPDNED